MQAVAWSPVLVRGNWIDKLEGHGSGYIGRCTLDPRARSGSIPSRGSSEPNGTRWSVRAGGAMTLSSIEASPLLGPLVGLYNG